MHSPTVRAMTGLVLATLLSGCLPKEIEGPVAPCIDASWTSTVLLRLVSHGGTEQKSFTLFVHDPDGASTSMSLDTLSVDTAYNVLVEVWSTTCGEGRNNTAELQAEGHQHQFFFLPDTVDLSIVCNDMDVNGQPIGIATVWTTNSVSSGGLRLVLRNELNKDAAGVSAGDITNAGGETDIDWTFPLVIE
jgi:hypothetical protein